MATKLHGWATTRTGTMFHYFGLTREGGEGYRANGSPLAMCHNALVAGTPVLKIDPVGERCDSCTRYLNDAQKALRQVPATKASSAKLGPGSAVTVTRGKGLVGLRGEITEASQDFPGFWYVKLAGDKPVLLSEGQLERR